MLSMETYRQRIKRARKLAAQIDAFEYVYSQETYTDCVADREENILNLTQELLEENESLETLLKWLKSVKEEVPAGTSHDARIILRKVRAFLGENSEIVKKYKKEKNNE